MILLTESGLHLSLMLSRKPAGRRLRRWLADEVLPQVVRTGEFAVSAPKAVVAVSANCRGAYDDDEPRDLWMEEVTQALAETRMKVARDRLTAPYDERMRCANELRRKANELRRLIHERYDLAIDLRADELDNEAAELIACRWMPEVANDLRQFKIRNQKHAAAEAAARRKEREERDAARNLAMAGMAERDIERMIAGAAASMHVRERLQRRGSK